MNHFKLRVLLFFFLFSIITVAQTRDTIFLWANKVPGEIEEKHPARKTDKVSDNVIRLTDATNPSLTVFQPEKQNNSGASIIICPGGGYNILAINKEGYEIAEWLNSLGYTAFVLQYRVPRKREGALNDIQRAIRWVRSNADIYGLYTHKIGVMGFSAGGHLSARSATSFKTESYSKQDTIDNVSSRPNFSMLIYPAYLDSGKSKTIDTDFTIDKKTPPFFIFGTADDRYGNSSLVMTSALRNKKVPVELHMLSQGGHGYGLREGNIAADTWPKLAATWLKNLVGTNAIAKYERTFYFPTTTAYPKKIPKKKKVWVFMMAGQSNMAGRGLVEPRDTIASERILTINIKNELILAKEPLHFNEPTMSGLDCGMSFAKNILKDVPDDVSILLIPTAVGGSSIIQWLDNSTYRDVQLLSNYREKLALAKKHGVIKGILWHQGESDARASRVKHYTKRLSKLVYKLRSNTGDDTLPFLIGELGSYSKNKKAWLLLNEKIKTYALKDRNTQIINTSDLREKGDKLHFDAESQRIMGKRFAKAYVEMIKTKR